MKGAVIAKPSFRELPLDSYEIRRLLDSFDVLYTFDEMGGDYFFQNFKNAKKAAKLSVIGYVERFYEIASLLKQYEVDVLVTVGGDGIASYSAGALISCSANTGIIGYPAGTANIGPIVQQSISLKSLETVKALDAIEVSCNGKVLGYGFNDVVFGTSLLGTIKGNWANIDALELALNGKVQTCIPASEITEDNFTITLNGKEVDISLWKGKIAQICISTLHQDNLNGRAIMGGLGESIGYEHPAALALLDKVSVDARPETWNCQSLRTTSHLCFCEKDELLLKGLKKNICVIIDGNPFIIPADEIKIRCKSNAIPVYGCGR